jgi:squalene-hopene/tetraprenyl-beta-curcumene cyclase
MRAKSCGGCHANVTYLMVRPLLKTETPLVADTRKFLEAKLEKPGGGHFPAEVVGSAAALAFDDARTGKLRPETRRVLDRMWSVLPISSCDSDTLVVELSPDYTAALAVVAANVAPENYAQTERAKSGLAATRAYLRRNVKTQDRVSLHSQGLLLWAAAHDRDVLTVPEREAIVRALLAKQNPDGGWSLASLEGKTRPAKKGKEDPSSDGYGTGFTVYVLRQAGAPASQSELVRAVTWLRTNQRASGRWFTPSSSAGRITSADFGTRDFYSQAVGTAFALLALEACGALPPAEASLDGVTRNPEALQK